MTTLFTRTGQTKSPTCTDLKGRPAVYHDNRTCGRCGGAGGADKWALTGWTCFDCGGKGIVPADRYELLYTAEQNAKLDAAQAKRAATVAAKHAAAQAAEAARIEAEKAAVIDAHRAFLDAARGWDDAFLRDLIGQVEVQARALSERQLEAGLAKVAKLQAERNRQAAASHLGAVGERIQLELEYVRSIDLTASRWDPPFLIWVFRCSGSTVIYKGGYPAAFDALPAGEERRGAKIAIVATVKAHDHNRKTGEPETIIQRPKAA